MVNDTGDEEEIVDSDGEVLGKDLWIRELFDRKFLHSQGSQCFSLLLNYLILWKLKRIKIMGVCDLHAK